MSEQEKQKDQLPPEELALWIKRILALDFNIDSTKLRDGLAAVVAKREAYFKEDSEDVEVGRAQAIAEYEAAVKALEEERDRKLKDLQDRLDQQTEILNAVKAVKEFFFGADDS